MARTYTIMVSTNTIRSAVRQPTAKLLMMIMTSGMPPKTLPIRAARVGRKSLTIRSIDAPLKPAVGIDSGHPQGALHHAREPARATAHDQAAQRHNAYLRRPAQKA